MKKKPWAFVTVKRIKQMTRAVVTGLNVMLKNSQERLKQLLKYYARITGNYHSI